MFIAENVTAIGPSAFGGCTGLTEIHIPSSVTHIDAWAFKDCSGLTAVTIPGLVTSIGNEAFGGCTNLAEMTVLATDPPTISGSVFYNVNHEIPVYVPMESLTDYQNYTDSQLEYTSWGNFTNFIGIVAIGDEANESTSLPVDMFFKYSLTQQIFTSAELGPEGLITSIAFDYSWVDPFTMPGVKVYMKNVDKTGFESDTDMVELGDATLVYDGTFAASGTGWVTLQLQTPFYYDGSSNLLLCCYNPVDGHRASYYTFRCTPTSNYSSLSYYSNSQIPDVNNVSTFSDNSSLLNFRSNIRLTINPNINIDFEDDAVKAICVALSTGWDTNHNGELSYAEAAAVQSFNSVFEQTNITSFNELQYFTGLTAIEEDAFYNCASLTSITLPDGISTIGSSAFQNCSSLTSITIPSGVTGIGLTAFSGCTGLTSITVEATVPPTLGNSAFQNVPADIPVYVPCGTLSDYQAADGWNEFTNLIDPCASQPQVVTLAAGTNWFSTDLDITLDDLKAALVAALPDATNISIKQKNSVCTYNGSTWMGALKTMDVALMYKITVQSPCQLVLTGLPINPAEHPITIRANAATWIGFPLSVTMSVSDALADFSATSGDNIKYKSKVTNYNGTLWMGGLRNFTPGEGYVFKSNASTNRTLIFPTSK